MKTLIIGGRSGLGRAITTATGADVLNIDINKSRDIWQRIKQISEVECVVLNAYDEPLSQLRTFFDVLDVISREVLFVVVASSSAYKSNPSDLYWLKYQVEKAAIIKAGRDACTMGYNVSVISPGNIDTLRNAEKTCDKLEPIEVADEIKRVQELYQQGVLLEHVLIRVRK